MQPQETFLDALHAFLELQSAWPPPAKSGLCIITEAAVTHCFILAWTAMQKL